MTREEFYRRNREFDSRKKVSRSDILVNNVAEVLITNLAEYYKNIKNSNTDFLDIATKVYDVVVASVDSNSAFIDIEAFQDEAYKVFRAYFHAIYNKVMNLKEDMNLSIRMTDVKEILTMVLNHLEDETL